MGQVNNSNRDQTENLKNQVVHKLKNSNCDKTIEEEKNQTVTKLNNSNCDKT